MLNALNTAKEISGPIMDAFVARIRKTDPSYTGAVPIEDTVGQQLALFERVMIADTGKFVNRLGSDTNEIL